VVAARARYSASDELLDMVCCFLDFQDIRDSPKYTEKPVMDLRVSGHVAQSESLYAFN